MAEDFTCAITSVRDYGEAHLEQLSCTESVGAGEVLAPRVVDVARVTFPPEKLNIVDINAKRRFLVARHHGDKEKILADLKDVFKSPVGGTAVEVLVMPDFADVAVVTGGIYFASAANDRYWPETGERTRQGDGFVWYKPDPAKTGSVLSEQHGGFTSGGSLLVDFRGQASLVRWRGPLPPPDSYRLIVQSNIVLVAGGVEDGNPDTDKRAMTALSAQNDGRLSLVVASEAGKPSMDGGFTYREFGEQLVKWGSVSAINLDGGPSTQMAVKKEECQDVQNPKSCVESLTRYTDETSPMPQLFSVSK